MGAGLAVAAVGTVGLAAVWGSEVVCANAADRLNQNDDSDEAKAETMPDANAPAT